MKRRKPPQKARKTTTAKPTPNLGLTYNDEILRVLTEQRVKLKRLYTLARSCLRSNIHVREALAVMRRVVKSEEMNAHQRDTALRLLAKFERQKIEQPRKTSRLVGPAILLPESWRQLIGCIDGRVQWIPDTQFRALVATGYRPKASPARDDGEDREE